MGHWNDGWWCGPAAFGGGHWGWLLSLGFWLVLALVLVAAIRYFSGHRVEHRSASPSALEILKRRYAAGEIEREEFEQRKQDLQ